MGASVVRQFATIAVHLDHPAVMQKALVARCCFEGMASASTTSEVKVVVGSAGTAVRVNILRGVGEANRAGKANKPAVIFVSVLMNQAPPSNPPITQKIWKMEKSIWKRAKTRENIPTV